MGKKLYPTDTLTQAQTILALWERIDLSMTFHDLSVEALSANIVKVQGLREKILRLQHELVEMRNERDATSIEIWQQVKKVRAGIKSVYGDDSTEYQLAGGTRLRDRKRPRRKATSTGKKGS
jgi:hypothetical protein